MEKIKDSKCYRFMPLNDVILNERNNFICEPGWRSGCTEYTMGQATKRSLFGPQSIFQSIHTGPGAHTAFYSQGTRNSFIGKYRNWGMTLTTQAQLVLRQRMSGDIAPIPSISRTAQEQLQFTFTVALRYIPIYKLQLCYHLFTAVHPSFNSLRTCTEYNKESPFIFMAHVRGLVP